MSLLGALPALARPIGAVTKGWLAVEPVSLCPDERRGIVGGARNLAHGHHAIRTRNTASEIHRVSPAVAVRTTVWTGALTQGLRLARTLNMPQSWVSLGGPVKS